MLLQYPVNKNSLATQRGVVRFQSTKAAAAPAPEISTTFLTLGKTRTFKKAWLSDPSTYPVIACMAAVFGLVGGVSVYYLAFCPDVMINVKRRGTILRE